MLSLKKLLSIQDFARRWANYSIIQLHRPVIVGWIQDYQRQKNTTCPWTKDSQLLLIEWVVGWIKKKWPLTAYLEASRSLPIKGFTNLNATTGIWIIADILKVFALLRPIVMISVSLKFLVSSESFRLRTALWVRHTVVGTNWYL